MTNDNNPSFPLIDKQSQSASEIPKGIVGLDASGTTNGVFYSRSDDGHRASYASVFTRELGLRRVSLIETIICREPVLFASIEEHPLIYVVASIFRAVARKRTVGLLFQPESTIKRDTFRRKIKYFLLTVLRKVHFATTFAIERFEKGDPESKICDNYIYDPQLWDLSEEELSHISLRKASSSLGAAVANDDRRVLIAIGSQNRSKGFHAFSHTYAAAGMASSWVFVFGGEVEPSLKPMAQDVIRLGGFGLDRFISDEEILDLYAVADLVWCYYDQSYNQASGVFGRAVQAGIPPLVREGSRLHKFCLLEGISHAVADYLTLSNVILGSEPRRVAPPVHETAMRKSQSLSKLVVALDLGLEGIARV